MRRGKKVSKHGFMSLDGRTHSAVFFRISPAEKVRPNGSREVDGHAKMNLWNDFQPILPMVMGENAQNMLK